MTNCPGKMDMPCMYDSARGCATCGAVDLSDVDHEATPKRTMTVSLSDAEMEALEELIAKKDLDGPNVFRQALKLYQAVDRGAATVRWCGLMQPPVAVNSHGLTPPDRPQMRLFNLGGWQILAKIDSNDDGEGVGIQYSVSTGQGIDPSMWLGSSEYSETAQSKFEETLANMTDIEASKVLSMLLKAVADMKDETND